MMKRHDLAEFFEKTPPLLRLYAWVIMFVGVLWLLFLGWPPQIFIIPFAAVIGCVVFRMLDHTFFEWPGSDNLEKNAPPLGVLVFTMCGRWVALFVWFRISLMFGAGASKQSVIPLLLLCYALAAVPIPLAGFPIAPALEIGAHLSIFLSLLLIVTVDGARFAASVLFFLVGGAALTYTVRDVRGRERG